jgi:hypothetical protein
MIKSKRGWVCDMNGKEENSIQGSPETFKVRDHWKNLGASGE